MVKIYSKFGKNISEFMIIYSVVLGVLMGLGFLFLGIIRGRLLVVGYAGIALLMGLITIPSLINERDEYDLKDFTPRAPKEPTRP